MRDLSILCITKAEPCVGFLLLDLCSAAKHLDAELVIVADGQQAFEAFEALLEERPENRNVRLFRTKTEGYIESVLDSCINLTAGRYIFRIDDDESLPLALIAWLKLGKYKESDHWKFNRAHLIASPEIERIPASFDGLKVQAEGDSPVHVITSPPLWPDHQTRLSTREKSFGRTHIHCGSPHGGGDLAPYPILHHKFVIKSREEREAILKRYDEIQPGAGAGFWQFSVPERGTIETISYAEFVRRGYTV